jgi:OOP family OmpA-OmpF porin
MPLVKSILGAVILAGGSLVFHAAHAQQTGFYLGASLGQSTFKEFCAGGPTVLTCDDKEMAWKLFGGYRFNPYVAVEATYVDWGEVSGTVTPGPRVVPLSQTAIGIGVVGSIPLGPQFSVFGKVARLWTEQETPASLSGNFKRDEKEYQRGLGGRFAFAPNWAARAEWERANNTKVEMLSIGLEYRF